MIYLDTHVVAWLYAGKLELIPDDIQKEISAEEILISPVVTLELQYLFEVGRVTEEGSSVVHDLVNRIGLKVDHLPFETVIRHAVGQTWTRDPFDRLIVGQASAHSTNLITKDTSIQRNYKHTIW